MTEMRHNDYISQAVRGKTGCGQPGKKEKSMAKYEVEFSGDFDEVLSYLVDGILSGSLSATLEDSSDFFGADSRCSVRVFERYSMFGKNRVSMSLTMFEANDVISLSAITSGGSQAVFWKINTLGEEAFLDKLVELLERRG